MQKLQANTKGAEKSYIEDAHIVSDSRWRQRHFRVFVVLAVIAIAASITWAVNRYYLEPKRDEVAFQQARLDWVAELERSSGKGLDLEAHLTRLSPQDGLMVVVII